MKASDVISRVRAIAGDTTVLQFSDSMLVDWINDGMRECVTDNLLLQKSANSNTVVGTASYVLPSDILKLYSVKYDNQRLDVLTQEEFDDSYQTDGTDRGTPIVCTLWAGNLVLYPAPDSIKTLQINYVRTPVDILIGNTAVELELPPLYHRRIVDYCLAMVAQQDDNMQEYAQKMDEFKTGVQNLKDHSESTIDLYPHFSIDPRDQGGAMW